MDSAEVLGVEFMAGVIEHVAHPIFIKDRAFRFVLVNRAFCEMVGIGRAELLGKSDYDFFPEAEANFFRQKDEEMFAEGREVIIEAEPITDARGGHHVLATTKVPMRGPSGEVTHLVGIIHDITRLKAAEDALRLANEELERRVKERTAALEAAQAELVRKERLAVLGQLAGGLAHQIRNPLGAIANAAYVLQRLLLKPEDDVDQAIQIIIEEAWQANRIITDLLDYARVRSPVSRAVDVGELLDQVLGMQTVPAKVRVIVDVPSLPPVAIDADQVRDALDNLMRNAIEAMEDGGELRVSAKVTGEHVSVVIADTGPGIAAEVRDKLFEPLVTTKPLGLGLGLTTTRTLIENQGGSIAWESAPGEGARFTVRLPLAT